MLEFFRKYQRYVFVFIAVITIASFSFFGTFGALREEAESQDAVIGAAIDGSPIRWLEVQRLIRFLSADAADGPMARGGGGNLLNDGVLRNDFLKSGLADLLAAAYFEPLKKDLQIRFDKAKRYRPLGEAKAVWETYAPTLLSELNSLQKETELTPATFSHLAKLYQQQSFFPPELLRRFLVFQAQRYGLPADPRWMQEDLALFGFRTAEEWLGSDFMALSAQFILNAAAAAEQKGFRVSLEEAKGDLIHNFETAMQRLAEQNGRPDWTYAQHLRSLGLDERTAAEIWRKVLLFRRYFQAVGGAAFVDRLPFQDFADFAQETAVVQKYQWPAALKLRNLDDLFVFETYLKMVAQPSTDPLALPAAFLSIEEVEKRCPSLVQAVYRARVAQVSKKEIGLRISLKQLWDWQTEDANWEKLSKEFSFLIKETSPQDRFAALEKLGSASRSQLDAFSRSAMVDQNPSWVEEALRQAPLQERSFAIAGPSAKPILSPPHLEIDLEKGEQIASLLLRAAEADAEAIASLRLFSDADKTFLRIEGVEKIADRQILTFEKARDPLREIAHRYLEGEYLKLRAKNSQKFQSKDGAWKPFAEVKEEVGRAVFSDVFKAIERMAAASKQEALTPDFYASRRFYGPMVAAWEDLKGGACSIQAESDPLLRQFQPERKECNIQRTSKEKGMEEEAFLMIPSQWSPVHVANDGQISFFYLQERKTQPTSVLDLLSSGKATLAADAQLYLAERLLETAKNKHAIVLPLQREPE